MNNPWTEYDRSGEELERALSGRLLVKVLSSSGVKCDPTHLQFHTVRVVFKINGTLVGRDINILREPHYFDSDFLVAKEMVKSAAHDCLSHYLGD